MKLRMILSAPTENGRLVNDMRLIDADELLKENFTETFVDPLDQPVFEWIIEQTPTVDAVPVVRCAECKYKEDCFSQIGHWSRDYILEQNNYEYHKLDFCSYGERKDGED